MKDASYPIGQNEKSVMREPMILRACSLLDERSNWIEERVGQIEKRLDGVLMPVSQDKPCETGQIAPVRPGLIDELHRKSDRLASVGRLLDSILERLEL